MNKFDFKIFFTLSLMMGSLQASLPADKATFVDHSALKYSAPSFPYINVYASLKNNDVEATNYWAARSKFFEKFDQELVTEYASAMQIERGDNIEQDSLEFFHPIIMTELEKRYDLEALTREFEAQKKEGFVFNFDLYCEMKFVKNPGNLPPLKDYACMKSLWQKSGLDIASFPTTLTYMTGYLAKITNNVTGEQISIPLDDLIAQAQTAKKL